jgi:hypothetical protein
MWSDPAMRAPFSGCAGPNSSRHLGLGDDQFLTAEVGEVDVPDDVVACHVHIPI